MASASASSRPSPDRPDNAQSRGRGRGRQAKEQHEVYGLLDVERHVKDDGRGLIVYARREHEGE